jgi:hypothetical protein
LKSQNNEILIYSKQFKIDMEKYEHLTLPTIFSRAIMFDEFGEALANMIATKDGKRSKKSTKRCIPNGHLKALQSKQHL